RRRQRPGPGHRQQLHRRLRRRPPGGDRRRPLHRGGDLPHRRLRKTGGGQGSARVVYYMYITRALLARKGTPMEFIYEAERIYVKDENGRMAAEVTFHQRSDRAMSIDHTYVSPELRGQG